MPKQNKKPSRDQWAELVAEYEQGTGDETQEAFARRQGVPVASFRYWLYKLRDAVEEPGVRVVEVTAREEMPRTRASVEVELENGRCTVRFGADAGAAFIGEVVAALAGRLEC
jgi:hypothetical protein